VPSNAFTGHIETCLKNCRPEVDDNQEGEEIRGEDQLINDIINDIDPLCDDGSFGMVCTTPTECDRKIGCMGSVKCIPDHCNECKAVNYDEFGEIITNCFGTDDEDDEDGYLFDDDGDNDDDYDGNDDEEEESEVPASRPEELKSCNTDADCYSNSIAAAIGGSKRYCAQGVCMDGGSCLSDIDCENPKNQFDDKRCMGYLTCTEKGVCDRICGEPCKDGSPYDNSMKDPCKASKRLCPEAVSCEAHRCGGATEALYFAADGTILSDCPGAADLELVVVRGAHVTEPLVQASRSAAFGKNNAFSLASAVGIVVLGVCSLLFVM